MKKIITVFLLAALIFSADTTMAQIGIGIGTGGFGMGVNIPVNNRKKAERKERIETEVQHFKKELDLNDSQIVKVRGLFIERERSRDRSARKTMTRAQFDERMQEILTKEQYAKFQEMRPPKTETPQEDVKKEKKKEKTDSSEWDDVYR